MYSWKTVGWAFVLGVVVTLATGFVNITPGILGATWYGVPLSWLKHLVIAPQYNPWRITLFGLVIDVLFWFDIFWFISYVWFGIYNEDRKKKPSKRTVTRKRRR
jgi:hypothetical protein